MIVLDKLTKQFGLRRAVDQLDLVVPAGEIYGLLGHNGAGKSTAIGMMLGQVWPTSGTVQISDFDVISDRKRALRDVGAIFESPSFYDYLSGYRNLQIFSSYTAKTPDSRIREVLDWVGLTGREDSKVSTYSHGMRARLALAQALLPNPKLLILDEPADGLDPEGIHELRLTIRRLRQELQLTILLSSHLLSEVEQLCTRIAVLNKGRKVFEGPLDAARLNHRRYRLKVSDFKTARALLLEKGLVAASTGDSSISLADGCGPDAVVRTLVAADIPVFEIAAEEATLEDFYLNLMRSEHDRASEVTVV